MADIRKLEELFRKHGYTDYKWINPHDIVIEQWVRMKCMFGCGDYGVNASCPPNVPPINECKQFFNEYKTAAILHFTKAVDKPEERFEWTREINLRLVDLEREVFLSGYHKVFMLVIDSCTLCEKCMSLPSKCKYPQKVRPTAEAMAVDVYTTVRKCGYHIQVLSDYRQAMNRYAFVLIE